MTRRDRPGLKFGSLFGSQQPSQNPVAIPSLRARAVARSRCKFSSSGANHCAAPVPRVAMELARHSDLRLTMKTYTDCGQLPLREVMESLPGFGKAADSRIDSRTLVPDGPAVSSSVPETASTDVQETAGNIDANHGESLAV